MNKLKLNLDSLEVESFEPAVSEDFWLTCSSPIPATTGDGYLCPFMCDDPPPDLT
jgi:hypothetical protein